MDTASNVIDINNRKRKGQARFDALMRRVVHGPELSKSEKQELSLLLMGRGMHKDNHCNKCCAKK